MLSQLIIVKLLNLQIPANCDPRLQPVVQTPEHVQVAAKYDASKMRKFA